MTTLKAATVMYSSASAALRASMCRSQCGYGASAISEQDYDDAMCVTSLALIVITAANALQTSSMGGSRSYVMTDGWWRA